MKTLCVYCGSSPGRGEAYTDAARALGEAMVDRGLRLAYGGAAIGVMGAVADRVLELGGEAVGVIPESLALKEVAHHGLTELHVVDSMHARKTLLAELSDGFVALPGGIGTFEELFEIWTWAQLGFHRSPCGLLNADGYYDGLLAFLDRTVDEAFVRPEQRAMLIVERDPAALLDRFAAYEAPDVPKWIGRDAHGRAL